MLRGQAQFCYGIFVTLCRITRIFCPAITRILTIQIRHDPVARHLGNNTSGCDGHDLAIPFDHGHCRTGQIRGQAVAVNQQMIRLARKSCDGAAHREICGLKNIERINLCGAGMTDTSLGLRKDKLIQPVPRSSCEPLGIPQPFRQTMWIEAYSSRCHWSCQRAASDLIHPHDTTRPQIEGALLSAEIRQVTNHADSLARNVIGVTR